MAALISKWGERKGTVKGMKCPTCQKGKLRKETIKNYLYTESGLSNIILKNITVKRCSNCGEELIGIPNVAGLHQLIARLLILRPVKLTPSEIRFLRKYIGWSGVDFAKKFHTDRQTVSRWESVRNRRTMNSRAELLLRATVAMGQRIMDYPAHMEEYAIEDPMESTSFIFANDSGVWDQPNV